MEKGLAVWWEAVTAELPENLGVLRSREALLACLVVWLVVGCSVFHAMFHRFFATVGQAEGGMGESKASKLRKGEARLWGGWEASVKKENSYYFAYNRKSDGLRPEDFDMEKPRRLSSSPRPPSPLGAVAVSSERGEGVVGRSGLPVLPGRPVSQYAFCDEEGVVEVLVELQGWSWKEMDPQAVVIRSAAGRELAVEMHHPDHGDRHLVLKPLYGEISRAYVKKRGAKRLTIIMEKKTAGPWPTLLGRVPGGPPLRRQSSEFEDVEIEEEDDDEDEADEEGGDKQPGEDDIEDLE